MGHSSGSKLRLLRLSVKENAKGKIILKMWLAAESEWAANLDVVRDSGDGDCAVNVHEWDA